MAFIDNYKGILFDMDGCLVGTKPEYIVSITKQVVKSVGGEYDPSLVSQFWFDDFNRDKIVVDKFKVPDLTNFWKTFARLDLNERHKHCFIYDDVKSCIDAIKHKGILTGIVTGGHAELGRINKERIGSHLFDYFTVNNILEEIQTKQQGIEDFMRKYELAPEQVQFVGNSPNDIHQAKMAGACAIRIDRGEYDDPLFEEYIPHMTITSLDELLKQN